MVSKSSFQSLGNGAYRVSGARVSPTTGRYVTRSSTEATAKATESPRPSQIPPKSK